MRKGDARQNSVSKIDKLDRGYSLQVNDSFTALQDNHAVNPRIMLRLDIDLALPFFSLRLSDYNCGRSVSRRLLMEMLSLATVALLQLGWRGALSPGRATTTLPPGLTALLYFTRTPDRNNVRGACDRPRPRRARSGGPWPAVLFIPFAPCRAPLTALAAPLPQRCIDQKKFSYSSRRKPSSPLPIRKALPAATSQTSA